ncbi:unnamed protein product [Ceutorhynchus assimilis]|uniref:SCP domain-containing protein n=1 Tax=Ceutorhynchus assimilis TaxID=467358 RepID=A0A9N9MYE2_9CUCU|nr:unnamed protein product [Ceutorhynchus assimilis]
MQLFIISFLAFCGLIVLCNGECTEGVYEYGVSEEEKNYILETHNSLREDLANDRVPGQPRAINLKRFEWDDYLAGQAQDIANTCEYGHRPVQDSRDSVGQNIARSQTTNYIPGANWTETLISQWWDEYKKYVYQDGVQDDTLHYTQMAWDDTHLVGCGYTYYDVGGEFPFFKFYVCNYSPAGNSDRYPYQTGESGCENLC